MTRHAERGCEIRRPQCLVPSEDGELRGSAGRTCRKERFCGYFSLFFSPIEAAALCFFFGTFRLFLKVAGRRRSRAAGRVDAGAGGSAHPRVPETPSELFPFSCVHTGALSSARESREGTRQTQAFVAKGWCVTVNGIHQPRRPMKLTNI